MKKPALLLLANGQTFRGIAFGAHGTTTGELCFNTSMTGYQEILTDPSYAGQLVVMTAPQIGNYGVNSEDVESDRVRCAGFIIREASPIPSNHRSTQGLDAYLEEAGIVGISGVDTRALTRILRSEGAMNAVISSTETGENRLREILEKAPDMDGLDLASRVSCSEAFVWSEPDKENPPVRYRVAALDLGLKSNIVRLLRRHGCETTVYPAQTDAAILLQDNPDGIFLSNGPGDPAAVTPAIRTVRKILGKKPIFGICLGHQILALALGARSYKLKFGHRGANHPVRNVNTGRIEITSQNHGFAIDPDTLPRGTEISHLNLNDGTLEGFRVPEQLAFSVQYHPEASPGPHDSRYLFKEFIRNMEDHAPAD